ncbi:MAG: hypothetical protein EOP84_37090, partial [Verrucomicrobiaceae bacterium]
MLAFALAIQSTNVDPTAMAILQKNRDAMFALGSFRSQCRTVISDTDSKPGVPSKKYQFTKILEAKPNLIRYETWQSNDSTLLDKTPSGIPFTSSVSNGDKQWLQRGNTYRVVEQKTPDWVSFSLEPWDGFFAKDKSIYEQVIARQK